MTRTQYPFLDLNTMHAAIEPEIRAAMDAVLAHGKFIMGPEIACFEAGWAVYCGATHAVGCSNGTSALHAILHALDIGPGDEVICPSHTFVATAESIRLTGARPVLAEILPDTLQIDPQHVASLITSRTRAIVAVHLYGMPADMGALCEVASSGNLALLEDASQGHGATLHGRRAGALGLAAAFSFFPGKNLGAFGDAGGVTTDDGDLARRVRLYVNHGRIEKYEHLVMGTNYRLDTLQAAVLLAKLPHLDGWIARRRELAAVYTRLLRAQRFTELGLRVPTETPGSNASWHLYVVEVDHRDALQASLRKRGVATGVHYPIPCHLQPSMAEFGGGVGSLPVTERAARRVLSLPMCPTLAPSDVEAICELLHQSLLESACGE